MGLDRRDHLVPLRELAAGGVVGARDTGEGVRGVRAAAGLEDELVHTRQAAEDLVEPVHEGEHALERLCILVWMELCELRPRGQRLADARVVLHRAGAEEADAHHPERLLGQMQVVAEHVGLRELRQLRGRCAAHRGRHEREGVSDPLEHLLLGGGEHEAAAPLASELHDERLVPDRGVVLPQAGHASTSRSAPASRSRSSRVCTSVTQ